MALKKKILAVDDVAVSLMTIDQILGDDYDVVAVNSADRAFRYLEKAKPALILMDIEMKPMDGIETLKHIREMDDTADIPVIMISSRDDSEAVKESGNLGISGYVLKPFKPEVLKARVREALSFV